MKIIKNSFIYLGTELVNKAIPFLLLPLITKYLTPVEYGIFGMYQVVLAFMAPFVSMSLDLNITKNFFKISKKELTKILNSIVLILHINLFLSLLIVTLITYFFHNPFAIPDRILFIIPIIIYVQTINTFNLVFLRNEENAFHYGIIQILITSLHFLVALVLLIFLQCGWRSLVYGLLSAHLVVSFYSLYMLKKIHKLDLKHFYALKNIYKVSFPLVFHMLGGSIIFLSDRIFIKQINGLEDVGLYSVGSQFGMITMIVINAIVMALNPWIYRKLANGDEDLIDKSYYIMTGFLFLGIVLWILSTLLFPYVVDEKYKPALNVVFWISMAYVARGWYQIFYNFIIYLNQTRVIMYITLSAGIINILLNYFLIRINGIEGAAQATLIAFLLMFIFCWFYVKRHYIAGL